MAYHRMVTKCVCQRVTFIELKIIASEEGYLEAEELQDNKHCGNGCGMCMPYVDKMMRTGETEFEPGDYH